MGRGGSNSALVDLWGSLLCASIVGLVRSLGVIEGLGSLLFFLFAASYLRLQLPCSYRLPRLRFDESLTMQLGPVGQPSHLGVPLSRETRLRWPLGPPVHGGEEPSPASLRDLRFRDPVDFQAGSLHAHPTVWGELLHGVKYKHADLKTIIYEGLKFNISLPTSREISVVKDLISIVLLLSCWKIADRATALQILYPLPY